MEKEFHKKKNIDFDLNGRGNNIKNFKTSFVDIKVEKVNI